MLGSTDVWILHLGSTSLFSSGVDQLSKLLVVYHFLGLRALSLFFSQSASVGL